MREHTETITALLLGAAYADEEFVGHEAIEIRGIVARLYDQKLVPPERVEQIKQFDPAAFDVEEAAAKLVDLPHADKMEILAMINKVVDSDGVLDLEEDVYIARAARAMGLEAEAGESLTLEIIEDEPPEPAKPPPPPASPPPLKKEE